VITNNLERYEMKRLLAVLRYYPSMSGISEEKLSQSSRSRGSDLNPSPPDYEAGVLPSLPW
jgi:hypothetical protein